MKTPQFMSKHDKRGYEIPDPKPMELPIGFMRPRTMQDQIREVIRNEISRQADAKGFETFEEADDFNVGDDPEMSSPYELDDEMQNMNIRDFVEEKPKAEKKLPVLDAEHSPLEGTVVEEEHHEPDPEAKLAPSPRAPKKPEAKKQPHKAVRR